VQVGAAVKELAGGEAPAEIWQVWKAEEHQGAKGGSVQGQTGQRRLGVMAPRRQRLVGAQGEGRRVWMPEKRGEASYL
jgi:hypothetical protein